MGKVAIVTDSVACLPRELVRRYDISVAPCSVIFKDRVYRDEVDAIPGEFYRFLAEATEPPNTSPPSPASYLEIYREVSKKTDTILCITPSARLTGVYTSALAAREMAKEELPHTTIEVLDSTIATMAQGFVVLAAARAAAEDKSLAEIIQVAKSLIPRVNCVFLVDNLAYALLRGRHPRIAALTGPLLGNIKPIFDFRDGMAHRLAISRTKPRAVALLLEIVRQRVGTENRVHIAVHHTNVPEEAERLRRQVDPQFDCAELYVTEFSPVMATGAGPGMLGLAYYGED